MQPLSFYKPKMGNLSKKNSVCSTGARKKETELSSATRKAINHSFYMQPKYPPGLKKKIKPWMEENLEFIAEKHTIKG